MSARIAYYQHIIDLSMARSKAPLWSTKSEKYRLHLPKTFYWPSYNTTFP